MKNPVKKNMDRLTKPATHRNRKKHPNPKHKEKYDTHEHV